MLRGRLLGKEVQLDPLTFSVGNSWQQGHGQPGDPWGIELIERMRYAYGDGGVMIDVGAGTGSWALLPAVIPNLRCWAFEPNPSILPLLRHNIKLNNANTIVVAAALSDTECLGELSVPVESHNSGLSTIGKPLRFREAITYPVSVTTLDSYVGRCGLDSIKFIKIDTEGAELKVLLGGQETIMKWKPAILAEYNGSNTLQLGYKREEIKELAERWGARTEEIWPEDILIWWEDQ